MDKISISDINRDNYYDIKNVLSASTIKSFESCEAAALAAHMGDYVRPTTTALLVGGYIDAALDSDAELDKFCAAHLEILNSRTGQLKSDFLRAAEVVQRCKDDHIFRALTIDSPAEGHQYIVLGSIGTDSSGEPIPCKGKLDFLLSPKYLIHLAGTFVMFTEWYNYFVDCASAGGLIVDLKSAANTDETWADDVGCRIPWLQAWHYDRQLAVYRELYRQMSGKTLPVMVLVATKEPSQSLLPLTIDSGTLDEGLAEAQALAPRVWHLMTTAEPDQRRCEKCAYCRMTRRLETMGPIDFRFAADF